MPRRRALRRRHRRLPRSLRRAAGTAIRRSTTTRLRCRAVARERARRRAPPLPATARRQRPFFASSTSARSVSRTSSSAEPTPRPATSRSSEPRRPPLSSSAPTRTSSARRGRRRIRSRRLHITDASTRRRAGCGAAHRHAAPTSPDPGEIAVRGARDRTCARRNRARELHESRAIPAVVFEALATGAPRDHRRHRSGARAASPTATRALLVAPGEPGRAGGGDRACSQAMSRCAALIAARGQEVFRRARASRNVLGERWRELATVRRWGRRYAHNPSESSVAASSSSQAASASGQITYQPIRYGNASSRAPNARPRRARPRAASRSSQTYATP